MKKFYKTPISGLVRTLGLNVKDDTLDDLMSGLKGKEVLEKLSENEKAFVLNGLVELEETVE